MELILALAAAGPLGCGICLNRLGARLATRRRGLAGA
jgi:hypothetical protein